MNEKNIKLEIKGLEKKYVSKTKEVVALNGIDLAVKENEFVAIVGPSGCGKSTMLNIVAGLLEQTNGEVYCNGKFIEGTSSDRGVVFQQYALFPWLTVSKNIEIGLKYKCVDDIEKGLVDEDKWRKKITNKIIKDCKYDAREGMIVNQEKRIDEFFKQNKVPYYQRKLTKEERNEIVNKYLKMVQLEEFAHSYPKELSGGMKQRVAIARAYAVNPEVLLLDEPFGALDAQTRTQLQQELLEMWQKEKKTCLFITHDIDEAIILAERVVIMSARPGRIKEIVDVNIAYPRDQKTKLSKEFLDVKNYIWSQVYEEYLAVRK